MASQRRTPGAIFGTGTVTARTASSLLFGTNRGAGGPARGQGWPPSSLSLAPFFVDFLGSGLSPWDGPPCPSQSWPPSRLRLGSDSLPSSRIHIETHSQTSSWMEASFVTGTEARPTGIQRIQKNLRTPGAGRDARPTPPTPAQTTPHSNTDQASARSP